MAKRKMKKDGTPVRGWGNGWLIPPTKKNGYRFYVAAWKYTERGALKPKVYKRSTGTTDMKEAGRIADRFVAEFKALRERDYTAVTMATAERERKAVNALQDGERTLAAKDALLVIGDGPSDSTMTAYRKTMKDFCNWLDRNRREMSGSNVQLRDIGSETMRQYLCHLRDRGLLPQSRAVALGNVKGIFKRIAADEAARVNDKSMTGTRRVGNLPWARLDIATDPWWTLTAKEFKRNDISDGESIRSEPRKPLTLPELHRLLDTTAERTKDAELWLLFRIGAQVGMRLNDAVHLTFGDKVKLDEGKTGRLTFTPIKTGRKSAAYVDTALGAELHDILAKLPQSKRHDALLMPTLAKVYDESDARLTSRIHQAFLRAGFEKSAASAGGGRMRSVYSFYSLRMTVARFHTHADLAGVAAALGHSRAGSNTLLYARGAKTDEDREAEAAAWERWYHSIDEKAAGTPQNVFSVRAGEIDRAQVENAQKPVYDAVCAMLANLETDTLRAIASEALRMAMANAIKAGAKAAS